MLLIALEGFFCGALICCPQLIFFLSIISYESHPPEFGNKNSAFTYDPSLAYDHADNNVKQNTINDPKTL